MKLFLFALSFLSAFGAVATFGREYAAAYLARSSDLVAFTSLADRSETSDLPLSSRGMRDLFTTCASVHQGLIYALQPPETRGAVDANCARLANSALEKNPTYSSAHTIVMMSASAPGDVAAALLRSHVTSPLEAWDAKLRLTKGLPLFMADRPRVHTVLESDIAFLVQSYGGRTWLAGLYHAYPKARPALVSVVEHATDRDKIQFLQEVRRIGTD